MERSRIMEMVTETLTAVLAEADKAPPVPLDDTTRLLGKGAAVDSLGLVSLLTDLEQRLEDECHITATLLADDPAPGGANPLSTVGTLVDKIQGLLGKTARPPQAQ